LKEKEVNIVFNMELQSAVFVLEITEGLSPGGRKHLIDEMKKNIFIQDSVLLIPIIHSHRMFIL